MLLVENYEGNEGRGQRSGGGTLEKRRKLARDGLNFQDELNSLDVLSIETFGIINSLAEEMKTTKELSEFLRNCFDKFARACTKRGAYSYNLIQSIKNLPRI